MTGGDLTLGAVLARLAEREREIAAQAETAREKIAELTALLDGLGRVTEEIRITRKTLLELPDPRPPAPPTREAPGPSRLPPDHGSVRHTRRPAAGASGVRGDGRGDRAQQHQQRPSEAQVVGRTGNPGRDRAGLVHPAAAIAAQRTCGLADRLKRKGNTGANFT